MCIYIHTYTEHVNNKCTNISIYMWVEGVRVGATSEARALPVFKDS